MRGNDRPQVIRSPTLGLAALSGSGIARDKRFAIGVPPRSGGLLTYLPKTHADFSGARRGAADR